MIWALAKVALPASVTMVFSMLMDLVNMIFVGHLGDSAKIAGIGLGNMYVNIISQSIILGLNGAIATLASQAYGAENFHKVGVFLNRGRFLVLLVFIPMIVFLLCCERVLLFLGQDPRAAAFAQQYTYYLIPAMFFHTQFDATRQYLNALHMTAVVTMTMVTTSILHIFWCFYLVTYLQMDVKGIGIATMISYTFNFVMVTALCLSIKELKKSFFFITKESIQEGISEYLKIAIPNAAMVCLDWGSVEILALIASVISVDATGAQIIALNAFIVLLMVPFGGQVGTVSCVGKSMGEGNAKKARTFIKIASVFMLIVDFLVAFAVILNKDRFIHLFTSNQNVF